MCKPYWRAAVATIDQTASQVNTGAVSAQTTAPVTTQANLASTTEPVNDKAVSSASDKSDVSSQASISSRAQKLQKLAEEFFPGGPSTLKITPEFVQRLNEYEFISQEQLDQLPASIKSIDKDNQDSVANLISNAETILEKLEPDAELKGLFDTLKNGVEQMKQFQEGGSQSFTKSSKLLANEISSQFDAMDKNTLTDQEEKTIEQMVLALNLTDKLNNNKISAASNSVINNYL